MNRNQSSAFKAMNRRLFLRRTTAAATLLATAPLIVPSYVVGLHGQTPPSRKINIAGIGVGGMGAGDIGAVAPDNNLVALCDVDSKQAGETFKKFPGARQFRDFRKMFDEMEKNIDAVVVATPDHTHAAAAMAAIKRRKHVYCEKPLAHSVFEVRELMKAAQKYKVVTQLGNQGHSFGTIRDFCEWIWDGAIGKVHTIHAGCLAVNSGIDDLPRLKEQHTPPPTLDWDLWLGPAEYRPYHPVYLPGSWRGWVPFGNGTVGDWMCHVVDPVFWALDLGLPTTIQADVKNYSFKTQSDAFPKGEIITYGFPANAKRGPITMKWFSGTERIPRPPEMDPDDKNIDIGAVVMGDKGTIVYGSHGAGNVRLIPQAKMDAYKRPAKTIRRASEHHQDWIEAIRNGSKAGSDFAYGGPLTEVAMLGVIAIKMAGTNLEWDADRMRFNNSPEANQLLKPKYRKGWSL
jgi:predicted dehydrogenase